MAYNGSEITKNIYTGTYFIWAHIINRSIQCGHYIKFNILKGASHI